MKPGCKTPAREKVFSDFLTAENNTETMNSARDIVNTKMPGGEFIKQWRNKRDDEIRAKNKSKQRELLEKQWGEYFTPSRDPKDPETSSTISMGYNTMGTSTYQKEQQITEYEPNVSVISTVPRPMITRYGADVPKEVLDNIPTFDGKPGELNQFLSIIESYSIMYRICKTDLVMLQSRGKVHKIIHHALQEDADVEWSVINPSCTNGNCSLPACQALMTAFRLPPHPISTKDQNTHWISSNNPTIILSKSRSVATTAIKIIILTTGMLS